MAIPKIALYYAFAPLADPEAVRLWQRDLCESLNLRGRIIISRHGINGTVGGTVENVKKYVRKTKQYAGFARLDVKWSDGTAFDTDGFITDFPRLSVKARTEIVSFGVPEEIQVDEHGIVGGGIKLTPDEVDALVAERGDDVVFFDGRNAFEAEIGRFKNAVVPDVETTRDFIRELESGKYDDLKDKTIVTYCTGGIRCEVLTPLMKARGFNEIYQIDGGIVRYGEAKRNSGLWEGSLYVFDGRIAVDFAPGAAQLSSCHVCGEATSHMANCCDQACRKRFVCCGECELEQPGCSEHRTVTVG
ncbi:MAG: rhodanese-related sulfurtransferase [Actinobacteria bacterium]|nr:rhodanese-related sulfurtransferase [Actinomycetota bacterium]